MRSNEEIERAIWKAERQEEIDREISKLAAELDELNLRREQKIAQLDKLLHIGPTVWLDRDRREIKVGCSVDILTSGKYKNFTCGDVIKLSKDWVHIKNYDGRTTTRAPKNVRVTSYRTPTGEEHTI